MLIVGLTGGIGSGKSSVAECFVALGVPVIDADQLSRDLVVPGQPALQEIVHAFGTEVLAADGSLDRLTLKNIVFNDACARERLETILHPRITIAIRHWIYRLADVPYAILMVPLLLETNNTHLCDRVLVIDIPESLQIQRACGRDHCSMEMISAIMRRQISRPKRLAAADDIIDNSGDTDSLVAQVNKLHEYYSTTKFFVTT